MSIIDLVECDRCGKRTDHLGNNYRKITDAFNNWEFWHLCPDCWARFETFLRSYSEKPKKK